MANVYFSCAWKRGFCEKFIDYRKQKKEISRKWWNVWLYIYIVDVKLYAIREF